MPRGEHRFLRGKPLSGWDLTASAEIRVSLAMGLELQSLTVVLFLTDGMVWLPWIPCVLLAEVRHFRDQNDPHPPGAKFGNTGGVRRLRREGCQFLSEHVIVCGRFCLIAFAHIQLHPLRRDLQIHVTQDNCSEGTKTSLSVF